MMFAFIAATFAQARHMLLRKTPAQSEFSRASDSSFLYSLPASSGARWTDEPRGSVGRSSSVLRPGVIPEKNKRRSFLVQGFAYTTGSRA